MPLIDMNADLGEGFGIWRLGDDSALLSVVTSANVACGFHAGDPLTMRTVCRDAAERGVAIGAQVSYQDLPGFGRREMDVPPAELTAEVIYQIAALDGMARTAGGPGVSYVKPHGALYNRIVRDLDQAAALADAVRAFNKELPILTLPGSALYEVADDLTLIAECYADRAYTPEGTLVSRREAGAVIDDVATVAERAVRMATEGTVVAIDGSSVTVEARSICVHGDTPGAVALAHAVRQALLDAGVTLVSFAEGT